MLPQDGASSLVVLTDGCVDVADPDDVLAPLREHDIALSFINLTSYESRSEIPGTIPPLLLV